MKDGKMKARQLFWEYRDQLRTAVNVFNLLKERSPYGHFPTLAKKIWRLGVLTEAWGNIATALCGGETDFLEDWRQGR